MTKKQQRIRQPRPVYRSEPDAAQQFQISARALYWLIGVIGGLAAAYIGIAQVWDRVEQHWRLERDAKLADEKAVLAVKVLEDKATTALRVHEQKEDDKMEKLAGDATRGRAWVQWSVLDLKATVLEGNADRCREKKGADCRALESAANRARQDEIEQKRKAGEVSK